jgi:hypothetical protein
MKAPGCLLLLLGLLSLSACGPSVDLTKGLQVLDVSTGWFDAGIVGGQNKLVPMISFKLKNVSDQRLTTLQLNVLFRRVTEPKEEWGSGFVTNAAPEGLAPGSTTQTLIVKSNLGYKGTDPREQLLHNSQFIDAKVDLFAKYASTQWVKIAEVPVERKLVTQ